MSRSFATLVLVLAALSAPVAASADAVADLHALFDREWERDLADNPLSATYLGDPRYDDRLPDISPAAEAARNAADAKVLDDLARIPREQLPPAEQLNYDLFRHEYETRKAALPFHAEYYSIEASGGPQSLDELAELVPFETVADYETWIRRMRAIPAFLDQYGDLLRRGAAGKAHAAAGRHGTRAGAAGQAGDGQARGQPLLRALPHLPRRDPGRRPRAAHGRSEAGDRGIRDSRLSPLPGRVPRRVPARDPRARSASGTRRTGARTTSTSRAITRPPTLTPAEIHAIGLKEVARNRAEMQKVMDEVGFKGSLTEFFQHLRTDPQFYYETGDELFRAYAYIVKMIDPELPKLFGKLYRTPFGLRPIPDNSAPNTTTAYYQGPSLDGSRPGYYYVNLYRPEVRPKYEMEVLSVHEAAPGHHLQIALAQEQTDLPMFRRAGGFTAYIEGWGLYSERLGYDLGLYKDPYSRFGQLTYDQWRAVRLVVDTGLHDMEWTRQQAIDYFMANAAKTEADIVNEIDRYISDPGQALAYKIGQLKFLELRARAEQALGDRYDIRAFHDTVLATGAVPLDILERTVDEWIAAQKAK